MLRRKGLTSSSAPLVREQTAGQTAYTAIPFCVTHTHTHAHIHTNKHKVCCLSSTSSLILAAPTHFKEPPSSIPSVSRFCLPVFFNLLLFLLHCSTCLIVFPSSAVNICRSAPEEEEEAEGPWWPCCSSPSICRSSDTQLSEYLDSNSLFRMVAFALRFVPGSRLKCAGKPEKLYSFI